MKFKFIQQSGGSQTTNDPKAFGKLCDQLRNIPKFMATVWGLKSPQIIIPIITGISNFKNWKNQKLEEQFRRGIIRAANKTEMWFITNGINGGISEMVGEAFSIERVSCFWVSNSPKRREFSQYLPLKDFTGSCQGGRESVELFQLERTTFEAFDAYRSHSILDFAELQLF